MTSKPFKVLVVDDSPLIQQLLSNMIDSDDELTVVGVAGDAYEARDKIKQLQPDVITLDVEMPKMNGVTFLRNLMRLHPMPVLMVSTLTARGADVTLEALELGAFDFVTKPSVDVAVRLEKYTRLINGKLKAAVMANLGAIDRQSRAISTITPNSASIAVGRKFQLIAMGASTGGTEAIQEVLSRVPVNLPPIVVTQHIPEVFSSRYAQRLNRNLALNVCEAQHHQPLENGCAYIAPGDDHLTVIQQGGRLVCHLEKSEPVNRHRPSVDKLFDSVLQLKNINSIGVLLTGMGKDGAQGLLQLKNAGHATIAQDEATSVVWGMPGAAYEIGAVQHLLPLQKIADKVAKLSEQ